MTSKIYLTLISLIFLSSCASLDSKNILKTGATTAITYAVAGPIPAVLNLGASVLVDEMVPDDKPKIEDVKSNKQLVAYIWTEFQDMLLYGAIIFLAFTTVITPWAVQRRARRKRKYDQYKYESKLAREKDNV